MHARADAPSETAASWPDEIFAILQRFDVRQVPYVPDAGHSQLIERVLDSPTMRAVPLTTEEEGVALLAGAWTGGQRGALLMQSSGVGNCINMFSLTQILRLPFLTLVTMRGEWGEFNPWQVPMGSSTQAVFELSGIKVLRANHPDEVRRRGGMAHLPTGFPIALVVEHNDREVGRLLQADGRETPHAHQHLAVAGDHDHRQFRLRQREAEPDHDRAAHGAPQIEIAVVIAGRRDVVGRGAEAADHNGVLAVLEQGGDDAAPFEKIGLAHLTKTLVPIRRCERSTAVGVQAL